MRGERPAQVRAHGDSVEPKPATRDWNVSRPPVSSHLSRTLCLFNSFPLLSSPSFFFHSLARFLAILCYPLRRLFSHRSYPSSFSILLAPPSYSCTLSLLCLLSLFLYVSPLLLLMHPGAKMRVAPCFFFSSILCTTFPSSAHVVGDISSLLAPLLFSHTRPFWRSGYRCYARRALRRSTNSHENYRRRPRRCPSGNWYLRISASLSLFLYIPLYRTLFYPYTRFYYLQPSIIFNSRKYLRYESRQRL